MQQCILKQKKIVNLPSRPTLSSCSVVLTTTRGNHALLFSNVFVLKTPKARLLVLVPVQPMFKRTALKYFSRTFWMFCYLVLTHLVVFFSQHAIKEIKSLHQTCF